MKIEKQITVTITEKEKFAFQLTAEILRDICNALEENCNQCPLVGACGALSPHNVVYDCLDKLEVK